MKDHRDSFLSLVNSKKRWNVNPIVALSHCTVLHRCDATYNMGGFVTKSHKVPSDISEFLDASFSVKLPQIFFSHHQVKNIY